MERAATLPRHAEGVQRSHFRSVSLGPEMTGIGSRRRLKTYVEVVRVILVESKAYLHNGKSHAQPAHSENAKGPARSLRSGACCQVINGIGDFAPGLASRPVRPVQDINKRRAFAFHCATRLALACRQQPEVHHSIFLVSTSPLSTASSKPWVIIGFQSSGAYAHRGDAGERQLHRAVRHCG
jgi:hypothetical protein